MDNQWYVITGAPRSGKTSVIKLLEKIGHDVVHETARAYIDTEMSKGRTLKEIRNNEFDFQKKVLNLKVKVENKLVKDKLTFLDRAIPDSHAYNTFLGISNDKYLDEIMKNSNYKKVFLFEPLPFEVDYARTESKEAQIILHHLLEKSYKKINSNLIKVPAMATKEDRLKFILDNL